MSGGGYRGRSFGPHGAHYNNSRTNRRDNGRDGLSRRNDNRTNRNYLRENFDSSILSRRGEHSQNNWPNPRLFPRWDQSSNHQQLSPSSSSSSPINNHSSTRSQNQCGHDLNGPIRFQYRNNSQHYYNRGGHRGYLSHGGYRFSSPREPQNFFSPYYSAPFRENVCDQHDKEILPEEPTVPLLGSEEERQQKITEAADELKRKLLVVSIKNDDVDKNHWENDDMHAKRKNYNELNLIKPIPELKHGPPELNLTPNDLKDIGKLNDKNTIDPIINDKNAIDPLLNDRNTIDPIVMIDCNEKDESIEMTTATSMLDHIQNNDNVNINSTAIPTINLDVSNDNDEDKNESIGETTSTVVKVNNLLDSTDSTIAENSNEKSQSSNSIAQTAVVENSTASEEAVLTIINNETSSILSAAINKSNNIEVINTVALDQTVKISPMIESVNITTHPHEEMNIYTLCENKTSEIPFLSNTTIQTISDKKEINLIEFFQEQVALSKNKSPPLPSVTVKNVTKNISVTSSLNNNPDNNLEYGEKIPTIINLNYSKSDILPPPPFPPSLPPQSYKTNELCLHDVPEYDSVIQSSNISSPCSTFHQSAVFNTHHHAAISPIISTSPVVNPSINIPAPISSYPIAHQSYVPMTHYAPGVSLSYPPVIPALDYVTPQTAPPPPLPHSSSIQPGILQDNCALNINEDDDVLDELKKAMEFAKQCMIMGNNDHDGGEDDMEFPTFPDLPPIMPESAPPENPKCTKKNKKLPKLKQGMFGPHLEAIAQSKEKCSKNVDINTKTHTIKMPDEATSSDINRRKVVFNLNSKSKVLNKNDDVWTNESANVEKNIWQKKFKPLSQLPVINSNSRNNEKSKDDSATDINKEYKKCRQSERIKESERPSRHDDKNSNNDHSKTTNANRMCDKNRHEVKKIEKQSESSSNHNIKKNQDSSPTISRKLDKVQSPNNTSEKKKTSGLPSSCASNPMAKASLSNSLRESSWKDRVIGRFLKMSKNDIQNMINNSSLRKFDIAMQHLVKEKKSSLSLEMRNYEDEIMKTSNNDNTDFMSQLQAILDPAATVDITNLPTNFIHQLSEVLHLDPLPVTNISNNVHTDKKDESAMTSIPEASTSSKIDSKRINESSRHVKTNLPVISTHAMSNSRKIDNKMCKDTVKNITSTAVEATTCTRVKSKRGQVVNTKIKSKSNKVTALLKSENSNEIKSMNLDFSIVSDSSPHYKDNEVSSNINFNTNTTAPLEINKTPTVVVERLPPVSTTPTKTPPIISRIETPITTRATRQSVELDKIFTAGILKAKAASSSVKASTVDLTIDETVRDTRTNKFMQHGALRNEITESMWRRKGIDDTDAYRNLTKEEYEAQYSEPLPHVSYEEEYKKFATIRGQKDTANGRSITSHTMHVDKSALYGSHSPPQVPLQNLLIQADGGDVESSSQYDSDTSSTCSSCSNSDNEPSLIDVTKVLKYIKEREKMAKKKSINEEIRDEVTAEIEKRRKDKHIRHKSHKSRSKKRDKRKKEKKVKKKKPKKKRRHKSHHLLYSDDNVVEENELPLRLLTEDEIKREPIKDELPETIHEVSTVITESRQTIPMAIVTSNLINKAVGTDTTMEISQVPLTTVTMPILPAISSTSALITSTSKLTSPSSLTMTRVDTNIIDTNVKSTLTSTVTSPAKTITAVALAYSTAPQSPILYPKTKAQLKQMPEAISTIQNNNSKIIEQKIIEPVSSTSENQIINSELNISSLLSNTSGISTTSVTTTQIGPKKLDIKAYHERALQRKLKEQERMKDLVANPTQLTQNLLELPLKNKLPIVKAASSSNDNQEKNFKIEITRNIMDQSNNIVTNSSSVETVTSLSLTENFDCTQSKLSDDISKDINKNQLNSINIANNSVTPSRRKLDKISSTNDIKSVDSKFVNIKSEGGKELKLKEKAQKRPHKIAITTAPVHKNNETKKLIQPSRNRQKKLSTSTDNTELDINNSLSSVNITTNDVKDNYEDNNSTENIETDALITIKKDVKIETNESLLNVNDVMIDKILSKEVNSIINSEQINIEQISSDQSKLYETNSNGAVNKNENFNFSHYFKSTKGLTSDELPDIVAQEGRELQINTQVPVIIENERTMEINDIPIISSEEKLENEDKITATKDFLETNIPQIKSEKIEFISLNNEKLNKNSRNTNNLLEVKVPSEIVSDLLKDTFEEVQSPASTPIILDKNIHSPLSSIAITELNSSEINTIGHTTSTDLLSTTTLCDIDTSMSSTYDFFHVDDDKIQNYDQLTLNELSDNSMDELPSNNQKELSHESMTDTELLSDKDNMKIITSPRKNELLPDEEKNNDKDKLVDCNINEHKNSIIHDINKEQLTIDNEFLTDKISSNNCHEEYSQERPALDDDNLAIKKSQNILIDNNINSSDTKFIVLEETESTALNDNNVKTELTSDNHKEMPDVNASINIVSICNSFIENEKITNSPTQEMLDEPCLPPTSNDDIVQSSLIPDKKLVKVIEEISTEQLPSPVREVSEKLIEKNEDNANNDDGNINININVHDNVSSVTEKKNPDCQLDNKLVADDDEINSKNVDDSNGNQSIKKYSTSTTRVTEINSFGRDESERSSSESRSIEQDRIQRDASFNPFMSQTKSQHTKHNSSRKSSSSKSSTPTPSHKKHKKYTHDRKKHKLTSEHVDDVISTNVVNFIPKPTTKNDVLSRMQEIDITIQQLMNEKMQLYQMLQTDEWPVNQSEETSSDTLKLKNKSQLPEEKINKTLSPMEPRIVMSRVSETANIKKSTTAETPTTKPHNSNTSKHENTKTSKIIIKSDDKRVKNMEENSHKVSKKRKQHYEEKESHKNKEIKEDGSALVKKRHVDELSRQKNKSPSRIKNSESKQRKPIKLSQLLAREFKPKVSMEKQRSESPTFDDKDMPKSYLDNEEKIIHPTTTEILQPPLNINDENSCDVLPSKNIPPNDDHQNLIYSDESSWDENKCSSDKHERSIGLLLLEQSIKREMTTKKVKSTELKKKSTLKAPQGVSISSINLDSDSSSKLKSNKKPQRKKLQQNTSDKIPTKIDKHILEVIDAVAKNRIDDLYTNTKTPEKKQKVLKKNEKQSELNKSELKIEDEIEIREKIENQSEIIKEIAEVKLKIPETEVTSTSSQSISQNINEPSSEENDDENEWTTLDSVGYHDEKNETEVIQQADDASEKNIIHVNEVVEESVDIVNNEKNISQSTTPVIDQQPDAQSNDNSVIIKSSKNNDASNAEKIDEEKIILEDGKISLNQSRKIDESSKAIAVEEQSDKTISLPLKSTSVNSHVQKQNEKDTSHVIEKSLLIDSMMNITNEPDKSISLDKYKLINDSITNKITTTELIKNNSSINKRDDKTKRSNSVGKELEQSKSMVKELIRSNSTITELERSKSTVNELEDIESPDDNDDDNELINKKRERPTKRRRQSSSRRSSRQSDDGFKSTSRSRSHSKRMNKSPSSRDGSTPDIEQKIQTTFNNSSNSNNSRRRSNTMSNIDKNNSIRKSKKRKNYIERTREEMMNCKVRLVDCKHLYLRSDVRSDILQRLGISRVNAWTPSSHRELTPELATNKLSSIKIDEDKNRGDDDSIKVDENLCLDSTTSLELNTDIIMKDPLSIAPPASPEYNLLYCNEDTSTAEDNDEKNDENSDVTSDCIEVLAPNALTSVNNPSSSDKKDDIDLQTMQYTVHKGPILDIKVFGDSFLAASEDGAIYRYCQRSNGILNIYKGHDAAVTCLYVHEVPGTADSGNTRWNLFSGSLDATLRCYDIVNGSLDRHIADVGSPIQCMDQAWGMIFVGTKSGHISRYDIKSGCLRDDNLDFSDKPVLALRASTEGARRVLIVASRNQPITIRDAQNGLYLRTISGQRTHTVYSLMRDRNLVYCGTSSTSIPVFDFISGEQVIQYTAGVGIVCMRLYRQLLFAGCYDGNIYVFDTKNTKLVCSIPGPGNMLLSMEIIDDKIIAGSKDRRLHAWRMPNQARIILAERA